jgi:molybdate-binding protein
MKLIIKNDIGKKKMEDLLFFLKSQNIEVEIKPETAKEKRIAEFKQALKETKEMAENIAAGKDEYETMDEFLKRL